MALLTVSDLRIDFATPFRTITAVDGVSFSLSSDSVLALVGESGCGKSVTALALARLLAPAAQFRRGDIVFDGEPVLQMDEKRLRHLRGRELAYVFQDPASALNPVFPVGWQVQEVLRLHDPAHASRAEVLDVFKRVDLPARVFACYPNDLSGGMRQRVVIAMALACRPRLLIADEPTTALDVTLQAQIMDLILAAKQDLGMGVLFITHNLGLVAQIADEVHVMYAGHVMESGPVDQVLKAPGHPYTQGLLDAVPSLSDASWARQGRLAGIRGTVSQADIAAAGCRFCSRCNDASADCHEPPPPSLVAAGHPHHKVRCHRRRSASL